MVEFGVYSSKLTVKQAVIELLAYEFPLSTNQLKIRLLRARGLKVSYQAVHKELAYLISSGIVIKENRSYMLNDGWIRRCAEFFSQTEMTYSKSKKYSLGVIKKVQEEGDLITLEFSSIIELDEYFMNIMEKFQEFAINKQIVMHYRHNWWPIIYAKREGEILKKDAANKRFYCLCGSNTVFDKWATEYESRIGMNVRYKRGAAEKWDLQVYGDVILQFHLDPAISRKIDHFFKSNVNIMKYNPKELLDVLAMSGKFTVIIYRNALLAEQLRKETLSEFI